MSITRRKFLLRTSYAGAGLAMAGTVRPLATWASVEPQLAPYLTGLRMAASPTTAYRAYRSKTVANSEVTTWIQIDLNKSVAIEAIQLFPAADQMYPGRDQWYGGQSFPLRFRIEASEDPDFTSRLPIADFTQSDFPDPQDNITQFAAHGVSARYVRLTATRLRSVKVLPSSPGLGEPLGTEPKDGPDYTLALSKVTVLSGGSDAAVGCKVSADEHYGDKDLLGQLTRPPRQDGESIHWDNIHAVTDPSTWKPPQYKAQAPKTGVTLHGGVFQTAMQNNIEYLLSSYSTDDLLRQFYERTGKIKNFKPTGTQAFWEEDLAGSNAGRFLMGAANTLRWIDHPELRRRMNVVVDGIEECRQPNGYIMAYPEDTFFYSERGAYTRAWVTHGLLEAAYSGNAKALPLLRGYYDWFNQQAFLPDMFRGIPFGGQGAIANTRVCMSPVGKPADAQLVQRYYQEDAWLKGLAKRDQDQVWQYPYDRPHCYLLTNLEAFLDLYLITGEPLYYDSVLGAWELYRAHWQQAGGSISIIEFEMAPPDSNYLNQQNGELCGSSFWVFMSQRFQLLNPDDERFASEIEKSIYNVAFADQVGGTGLRYHTTMEGKKEKSTHSNTCCEGQGTRLLGSLPEHIYSIAPDGLYVHLYEPSTIRWQQGTQPMELTVKTRFPFETKVQCMVRVPVATQARIRIRVPSWTAKEMKVSVNGKAAGSGRPGTYLVLDRQWLSGDTIDFTLPAEVRVKRYNGKDQIAGKTRYSFEYGPVLLAAVGASRVDFAVDKGHEAEHLAGDLQPVDGASLHFTVPGNPGQKLVPYWEITEEEFTCYPTITVRA
jgi:hypothetical protein